MPTPRCLALLAIVLAGCSSGAAGPAPASRTPDPARSARPRGVSPDFLAGLSFELTAEALRERCQTRGEEPALKPGRRRAATTLIWRRKDGWDGTAFFDAKGRLLELLYYSGRRKQAADLDAWARELARHLGPGRAGEERRQVEWRSARMRLTVIASLAAGRWRVQEAYVAERTRKHPASPLDAVRGWEDVRLGDSKGAALRALKKAGFTVREKEVPDPDQMKDLPIEPGDPISAITFEKGSVQGALAVGSGRGVVQITVGRFLPDRAAVDRHLASLPVQGAPPAASEDRSELTWTTGLGRISLTRHAYQPDANLGAYLRILPSP
jgi:hypothetical protein